MVYNLHRRYDRRLSGAGHSLNTDQITMQTDALFVLARTFAISGIGVALFLATGLSLPWLLGPMFANLVAALAGLQLRSQPLISATMRTILGLAVGASITPALIAQVGDLALTLVLVPPFVLFIALTGYPYFRRVWGFDKVTSYYASVPGGLQDMLIFGEEAGGDPRALSLIHATRVLVIVTALPLVLTFWFGIDLTGVVGQPARDLPPHEIAIMVVIAFVGWRVAAVIGLFGAAIIGPMILAAAASLADVIHSRPPSEFIIAAQFFIGTGIGTKYSGLKLGELRRFVVAAIGYAAWLGLLTALMVLAIASLGLAPPLVALLSFSPGGQGEMAVIAIVSGADVAVVVAHHIVRLIAVLLGAPLVQRLLS